MGRLGNLLSEKVSGYEKKGRLICHVLCLSIEEGTKLHASQEVKIEGLNIIKIYCLFYFGASPILMRRASCLTYGITSTICSVCYD